MTIDRLLLNRAFWDLGLRFQWDEATWAELCDLPDVRSQLRCYLERHQPHLLSAYDVDFLASMVEAQLAFPVRQASGIEAYAAL